MAYLKTSELRAKTVEELNAALIEALQGQFAMRMQRVTQQLKSTAELRNTRRYIARIRTLIAEKRANNNA